MKTWWDRGNKLGLKVVNYRTYSAISQAIFTQIHAQFGQIWRRIHSSKTASAKGTSPVLLVEPHPTLREPKDDLLLFSSSSSQSSRSCSCSAFPSLIDWTIEGTILSYRNTAASFWRFSSVHFFTLNKAIHGMFFWERGDDHNDPSSSDVQASRSCCLFVSNLLHSFYCFEYNFPVTVNLYFYENFMVDNKLQGKIKTSKRTVNFENGSWLIA